MLLQGIFLTQGIEPVSLVFSAWTGGLFTSSTTCDKHTCTYTHTYSCVITLSQPFGGASGKEPPCQCRRHKGHRFDPWVGRSPGEGHGNSLQCSCLENPMKRGAWWAIVHSVRKSWTQLKQLKTQRKKHFKPLLVN